MKTVEIDPKFLFQTDFVNSLTKEEFTKIKSKYIISLKENEFSFPDLNTFQLMLWCKREKVSIGPYKNLSFFEISNRIYTDIVLLQTAQLLFLREEVKLIKLNLGNKSGNDLEIEKYNGEKSYGEGFNSSISFFQIKLRAELKKFDNDQSIRYICFNQSALDEKNKAYFDKKKVEFEDKIEFIVCDDASLCEEINLKVKNILEK